MNESTNLNLQFSVSNYKHIIPPFIIILVNYKPDYYKTKYESNLAPLWAYIIIDVLTFILFFLFVFGFVNSLVVFYVILSIYFTIYNIALFPVSTYILANAFLFLFISLLNYCRLANAQQYTWNLSLSSL